MTQTISPARALARWLLVLAASLIFLFAPIRVNDITSDVLWWSAIGLTTAVVINLGLIFTNHKLHSAASIGVIAYLTLGNSAWGTTLLVMGGSSAFGVLLHQIFIPAQPWQAKLRETLQMAGQVVLSLAAGMGVYALFDGHVPFNTWGQNTAPGLAAFSATTLIVYLVLVRLVSTLKGSEFSLSEILRVHAPSIAGVVFLPYIIAIAAAYSYQKISTTVFSGVILIEVFLLIIIYTYNRNLQRSEQQVRELTRLTRLSNSIRTSLDLETLMQTVYLQVSNLLDVENFSVIVQDQASQQIQYLMNVRQGRASRVPDGSANDMLRYIVEQQQPILVHEGDTPNASNLGFAVPEQRVKSWLGVPFDASEQTKGAMVVHSDNPTRKFGNDDRRRLSVVARQVGVAIDNAMLYDLSRTRIQQLRDLNEVGTELSSTLEMNKVLDKIVAAAKKVMNGDAAALFIWTDLKRQNISLARAISMSDGFTMMPSLPLLAQKNKDDDLIIVHDARQDERVSDIWITLVNEGKSSWVEILLQNIDDPLGVLVVYYNEPQPQTEQDIEVLRTFASQSALAIQNAQLYTTKEADLSRRIDQLSLLQRLSQALFLGTMRLNEMYHTVLQRAAEGTSAESGALFLTQEESPYCMAQIGYASSNEAEKTLNKLVKEVFLTGEMVLVADTQFEDDEHQTDKRCQLAIPILHDIRVIGAILLESPTPNAFGPEDMFFVMQVGTQARIALENVRLFQNIETTRDRLQAILNSMREAILLVGPQGHIRLANPPVRNLLQLEPTQIMNRTMQQLVGIPPLDIAHKLGFEKDVLANRINALTNQMWQPKGEDTDYDLITDNRRRFITRFDIPVESAEGMVGWLMVFMDMTEERELAQAREDLSHMIVHDLRGPLTAINMSLKMLETMAGRAPANEDGTPTKLANSVIKTTDTSRRAVRKMLNMVNSLLDVAKMESGTMELEQEAVNLHHIARQVIDELSPIGEELEVKLLNKISLDTPLVDVDGEKIERTLLNLVDNALKFTPSQGVVSIEVSVQGNGFIKVMVRDTGPGVPEEYKANLFDRYAQIRELQGARKGTGLGLTFCKFTVEAHGGTIWIEDNPKGGAIFAFTLPTINLR